MIYKILEVAQTRFSGIRNLQIIRNASKIPKSTDSSTAERNREIDEGLKIEASLFGNSTLVHKPSLAREVLQRMRRTSNGQQPTNRNPFVKREPIAARQSKIIDDPQLGLSFIRLNLHDPQLHTLLTTARSRKRRDKDSQIVVEGRRLIQEALECRMNMRALIFSQTDQLELIKEQVAEAQRTTQSKIYKVPQHDLKTWSTLSTPPGLMAIFERPSQQSIVQHLTSSRSPAMPISVVCDNIREPNNLGSIIRTCAAIPCLQVIVTRGCCDPWESKALRGGCGGHFRVPIRDNVDWSQLPLLIPADAADDCCVFVAENNLDKLQDKTMALEYSNLEGIGSHNVVVIGGESHGVSSDAYRFLETVGKKGKCLYIPLAEGVDSLNVASALTLMLYELRKHLQKSEIEDV